MSYSWRLGMKAFIGAVAIAAGIITLTGAFLNIHGLTFGVYMPSVELFAGIVLLGIGLFMVIWEVYSDEEQD